MWWVILDPHKEPPPNGRIKRFYLIRGYVILILGIVLVVYGVAPPVDPAIFGFGGTLLGFNPMVKAQEKPLGP
jgi:hypothetical protein